MAQVSILIPVYNAEPFLATAIESVLKQTYEDWELLILDDCSSDNSYSIASSYSLLDSRITVRRNDRNIGMVANWNSGISQLTGVFFIKLDADDYWHPEMLKASLDVLTQYPDVALVFTNYCNVDREGKEIDGTRSELPLFVIDQPFSCIPLVKLGSAHMLKFPILRQGVSLLRRSVFDKVGVYRYLLSKETEASSDTEFYFRVGCHYNLYCINAVYYYYRLHTDSISKRDYNSGKHDLKLYEVKTVINDYYFKNHAITVREWRANKIDTDFKYRTARINVYRCSKKFLDFIGLLLDTFLEYPEKTVRFYVQRLLKRG